MNAIHHKAVMEFYRLTDAERTEESLTRLLAAYSMTLDDFSTAKEEIVSKNDVEGTALEIAALDSTFPNWEADSDVYLEATARIMDEHCPLLNLYHAESNTFPEQWERYAEEMVDMIFDAAERIGAAVPLAV